MTPFDKNIPPAPDTPVLSSTMALPAPAAHDGDEVMRLNIKNVMTESLSLYPFLQNIGRKLQLSQQTVSSLVMALEEQVINLIRYAYPRGEEGVITLKAHWHKATSTLRFTLIDHGTEFNPTAPGAEGEYKTDRSFGAMGISMISQFMDTVDYVRRAGTNILRFTKKITRYHSDHEDAP